MHRSAALIAIVGVLASAPGCVMSRRARTTTMAVGLGTAVVGALVGSAAEADTAGYRRRDLVLRGSVLGGMLTTGGVVAFFAAVVAREPAPPPPVPREPSWGGPPSLTAPIGTAHLPARPASAEVLRLARQVRSLVAHHACGAVEALVGRIAAEDPGYAAALRVTMPCVAP